jgi:hypothetical protein
LEDLPQGVWALPYREKNLSLCGILSRTHFISWDYPFKASGSYFFIRFVLDKHSSAIILWW